MITVKCLGHIGTEVGGSEIQLDIAEVDATEIVDTLRSKAVGPNPGFSRFNTLVMVGDGEAFVPATSARRIKDGDRVVLIPFSHGG
jgi:molybdopterin converting factor small subunit